MQSVYCAKAYEENGGSWKGELPKETIGHIQSAGCLGQKEEVTAAHNACIRELLQEIDVLPLSFGQLAKKLPPTVQQTPQTLALISGPHRLPRLSAARGMRM